MVILSTGCPMSFFGNPFVKSWLSRLNPKHRPVYRLKLLRIIRCINDVLTNEVISPVYRLTLHPIMSLTIDFLFILSSTLDE